MDQLKKCAEIFSRLLDIKYVIKLGRKGVLTEFEIMFDKKEFFHLIGLQKLVDLNNLQRDRGIIFDEIMQGKITYDMIQASDHFHADPNKKILGIEKRFTLFCHLENLLDSSQLIFKYNNKIQQFSKMRAEFLLESTFLPSDILYLFIDKREIDNVRYCRSFFPKSGRDYAMNQTRMTLLYKEKIYISTGLSIIQINKLKK